MFSRALNRVLWIGVIALIIFLGLKTRKDLEILLSGVGQLEVSVSAADASIVHLDWRGQIDAPMAQRLADAYEQHRRSAGTFVLSLSSPGGALDHGARVIRLLKEIARTHRLETRVESGEECASMCVPVYLQGEQRTAASDSAFMFHEVSFREHFSEDAIDVPASATAAATAYLFDAYFRPAGVPARWIRTVRRDMSGGRDVWKSGAELVGEKARIVQSVD
jgi:hypothetical protein